MLDAPRELLARAALPLEAPEKALLLLVPDPWLETWRFPIRSPPPLVPRFAFCAPPPAAPRFTFCAPVPAAEFPLLNWLPLKLPAFCRAVVCLCDMVLPRAFPL